jgi:hypothetical protein
MRGGWRICGSVLIASRSPGLRPIERFDDPNVAEPFNASCVLQRRPTSIGAGTFTSENKRGRTTMEQHTDSAAHSATISLFPVDLVGLGKKRMEALLDAQSKLVDTLPTLSREWMSYAQAERELSSELLAKLTAARSIPESAKVYQEWLSRRMDMLAEETRRMLADAQKLVDVGARLFALDVAGRTPSAAEPIKVPEVH